MVDQHDVPKDTTIETTTNRKRITKQAISRSSGPWYGLDGNNEQ